MMKTEYTRNCGFLQRDSVEHKEYAEAYSTETREVEERDGADPNERLALAGYFDISQKYKSLHSI